MVEVNRIDCQTILVSYFVFSIEAFCRICLPESRQKSLFDEACCFEDLNRSATYFAFSRIKCYVFLG